MFIHTFCYKMCKKTVKLFIMSWTAVNGNLLVVLCFFYKNVPVPMHAAPLVWQMLIRQCGKYEVENAPCLLSSWVRVGVAVQHLSRLWLLRSYIYFQPQVHGWQQSISTHLQHRMESNPSDDFRSLSTILAPRKQTKMFSLNISCNKNNTKIQCS